MTLKSKRTVAALTIASFILLSTITSFADTINYVYDDLNRLRSITYADGTMTVYSYDEIGNRLSLNSEFDTDMDGIPDDWEIAYGLNPNYSADAGGDKDGDGLTNLQEYQYGSNPENPDTDGDWMPDGYEVENISDPVMYSSGDSDGDGQSDMEEYLDGIGKIQCVDCTSDNVGWYTSIKTDLNKKAHISYYDYTNRDLKYATNATGNWIATIVDSAGDAGLFTSLAIDSNNNIHISYYDYTNQDLKYATNSGVSPGAGNCFAGSNFNCAVVDGSGNVGQYASIAIDKAATPNLHISYYDATNGDLKYTTKPVSGGAWAAPVTVDSAGNVGRYSSIATDSNNNMHISYHDSTNYDLKYATNKSGLWVADTVASSYRLGEYTSIAVDSSNFVHISHYNDFWESLNYATNESGQWVDSSVDNAAQIFVGEYTAIAIGSNNKIHISYYDYTNTGALKYATKTSGLWVKSKIDSTGNVGLFTSIATDSNNDVHISYYDSTNGNLMYVGSAITSSPFADPGGPYSGIEGQAITLDGSGSRDPDGGSITLYEWDINNDGIYEYSSPLPTQAHAYVQQGIYTVRLRVTNNLGATGEATTTATISDSSPTADFTAFPTSGAAPLTVTFTNSSTGYDQPLTYAWDFDNNGSIESTLQNPSAIYTGQGTYSVRLTVTDADGSADTLTRTNYIIAGTPNYILSITKTGTGTGSVTSSPSGIDCGIDCAETYVAGTAVTLTALPTAGSQFTGWTGGGCGGTNDCALIMNADTTVIATFDSCSNLPVRLIRGGTPVNYYSSLQTAYNDAMSGDVIQSQAALFIESFNAGDINSKTVTIEGGYDCNFTAVTGKTALKGQMTISKGTNRATNFVIKK